VLVGTVEADPGSQARLEAFEQGLHALGWTVGRNVHIDYRFGSADPALTQKYAAELVGMAPDVILANSPLVLRALRQQTSTIPIVFACGSVCLSAMKHEASRACSHYRLSNVISGWRCRATI
jgi:putative ABC transport system substrate-binding protein